MHKHLTGIGFGATTGKVTFNGTSATVTSWSGTVIKTTVPTGATTGNVVVTANGNQSNGVLFTISAACTSSQYLDPVNNKCVAKTCQNSNYNCPSCGSNQTLTYNSDGSGICSATTTSTCDTSKWPKAAGVEQCCKWTEGGKWYSIMWTGKEMCDTKSKGVYGCPCILACGCVDY